MKTVHFMYVPFTGLGLYQGFRGNRFLRNRIKVFKQFVVPSLQNQTCKDFILWCSWRPEERNNPYVKELIAYLENIGEFKSVHTFSGCCFYDDKYPDDIAQERLINSLQGAMWTLVDVIGEADEVLMTIQPSDDLYSCHAAAQIQAQFKVSPDLQSFGFKRGYLINYFTSQVAEWNPKTNPPFFSIKFPKEVFLDPLKHMEYTGPYKSHEYVGDKLKYETSSQRYFMVGTHADNISTVFDHPYRGKMMGKAVLKEFGIDKAGVLVIPFSLGRVILNKLPYGVKRKLRYWAGDKNWILRPIFAMIYNALRA